MKALSIWQPWPKGCAKQNRDDEVYSFRAIVDRRMQHVTEAPGHPAQEGVVASDCPRRGARLFTGLENGNWVLRTALLTLEELRARSSRSLPLSAGRRRPAAPCSTACLSPLTR